MSRRARGARDLGHEGPSAFDGGAALASFLKAALFTCFSGGTALGCVVQLGESRYLPGFLVSSAIVVGVWFVSKTWVEGPWKRLLVLALLCAAFTAAWATLFHLGPERDELEQEGDALLVSVEDFHARSGRYPASLAEAGCTPRWNRFGGWQYEVIEQGNRYRLRVGQYGLDGFVLYRYSEQGDWDWDT
jgi:hypothetical protein